MCRGRVCDLPVTTAGTWLPRWVRPCSVAAHAERRADRRHRQPLYELVAKGSADDLVELYADDATVEDPVGGEVHIGRQAIRGFYSQSRTCKREAEMVTLRVAGHEAAFHFRLTVTAGESRMRSSRST